MFSAGASVRKCAVCGDSPAKIHYGQLACFGCKGFFRRAVKDGRNKYVCRFEKNCQINKNDRNACRYCRFRRCLLVGMNPDFVRPDREEAKQKAHRTLSKKKSIGRTASVVVASDDPLAQMPSALRKLFMDLSSLEGQLQSLGESNFEGVAQFSLKSLIADRSLARKASSSSPSSPPSADVVCIDRVVATIDFTDGFLSLLQQDVPSRKPSVEDKCSLIADTFLPLALVDSVARLVAKQSSNFGDDLARSLPTKNLSFSFFSRFSKLCEAFKKRSPTPTEFSIMRALLVCYADATQLSNSLGENLSTTRENLQELLFRLCKQTHSNSSAAVAVADTVVLLFQARIFSRTLSQLSYQGVVEAAVWLHQYKAVVNISTQSIQELSCQLHSSLATLYPPSQNPAFPFYLIFSEIFHPPVSDLVAQVIDSRSSLAVPEPFVPPRSPVLPPPPPPMFAAPLAVRPRSLEFSSKIPLTLTKSIEEMLRAPGTGEELNRPLASDWADGVRLTPVFNRDVVAQFFPELTNQLM